jgi:UDP-galactopyranose mutase
MAYDLVIGGAGLTGSVLAYQANKRNRRVLVIECNEIGGLCRGDKFNIYGPHIFHTSDRHLWEWVNSLTPFIPIHYSPLAVYHNEMYSFPPNMLTLNQLGITHIPRSTIGRNFEEYAINYMGEVLYEKFFYHYTKKQWGREPRYLPVSIFKRIPIRMDYVTSYYTDTYVGIPEDGWDAFFRSLLHGVEVVHGDFIKEHTKYNCRKVFTGSIDELHDYKYGRLDYRSMSFKKSEPTRSMAINYTDDRPYTRDINYKYLWGEDITIRETPTPWVDQAMRMYPTLDNDLYKRYKDITSDIVCAGRLGTYQYLNMDQCIEKVTDLLVDLIYN